MSKLTYNRNVCSGVIIPNLASAVRNLNLVQNAMNSINLPSDFIYKTYINDLATNIKNYSSELNKLSDKIEKSLKSFGSIEQDVSDKLFNIENYSISIRNSAIK